MGDPHPQPLRRRVRHGWHDLRHHGPAPWLIWIAIIGALGAVSIYFALK